MERTSISEAQLLKREMADGVPALLAKIGRWRPRVICFNGKGMWLHVEHSLQQQLIQSNGSDNSATTGSRILVPKREDEEELKPIIPDMGQARPVKTEQVTARSLQQPSLKKDTSNDGVATRSRVAASKREEEECKPTVADTEQERPLKTKRRSSASGAGSTPANSSNLDAGRVLRPSTQPTFVYGIQPYKAVHNVPKVSKENLSQCLLLTDTSISCSTRMRQYAKRFSACFQAVRGVS